MRANDDGISAGPACPPVLVLGFNRPDTTRRVLESLRAARPALVFLAVDGPRPGSRDDASRVAEVQSLTGLIDWPCVTKTLFRKANLGCKLAVSEAISWFFAEVESGIILEDDCVAHPSFFPFAAELLDRVPGRRTRPHDLRRQFSVRLAPQRRQLLLFALYSYLGLGNLAPGLASIRSPDVPLAGIAGRRLAARYARRTGLPQTTGPDFRRYPFRERNSLMGVSLDIFRVGQRSTDGPARRQSGLKHLVSADWRRTTAIRQPTGRIANVRRYVFR